MLRTVFQYLSMLQINPEPCIIQGGWLGFALVNVFVAVDPLSLFHLKTIKSNAELHATLLSGSFYTLLTFLAVLRTSTKNKALCGLVFLFTSLLMWPATLICSLPQTKNFAVMWSWCVVSTALYFLTYQLGKEEANRREEDNRLARERLALLNELQQQQQQPFLAYNAQAR